MYCVKAAFCCLQRNKNKEYHHGGFQEQNTQLLVNRYNHMNSRNDRYGLWLKAIPVAWFFVWYSIQ